MIEAIAAGASIIAGMELSAKVASLCFEYSTAVKNDKSDIERIQGVSNRLKTTLEGAQQLLKSPNVAKLRTSQKLRDWLAGCSLQLTELQKKLGPGKRHQVMRRPTGPGRLWLPARQQFKLDVQIMSQRDVRRRLPPTAFRQ